jgi:cytoskeletal protein RodZ
VSVGKALAKARRQAGLTVTQVSDQTRIREMIITAVEGDDFSACGGDLCARGYIRIIARAVGADPEPLIREYQAARPGPQVIPDDTAEPVTPTRMRKRRWPDWVAVGWLALAVWIGFYAYHFLTGSRHATSAPTSAGAHPVTQRPGHRLQAPSTPKTATQGAAAARALTPASAAAFGLSGAGHGDNSGLAHLAIDANPATAWHTDWYATAHFANLYPGTGLLVDMGRPVTITAARVTLGTAHGVGLQLRVGAAPALADLRPAAYAANTGGVVRLRLPTPARGRYVLIWFTSLPPDPAGTFQASVYDLRLEGRP